MRVLFRAPRNLTAVPLRLHRNNAQRPGMRTPGRCDLPMTCRAAPTVLAHARCRSALGHHPPLPTPSVSLPVTGAVLEGAGPSLWPRVIQPGWVVRLPLLSERVSPSLPMLSRE